MSINQWMELLNRAKMVDLSHTLEENIPAWFSHARFFHNLVESYTIGDRSCHYQLVLSEHTGTHVDAPLHFIKGARDIAEMPLSTFTGRAATIQVTDLGENGALTKQHVLAWEELHGEIGQGDIVLLRFGWDELWKKRPNATEFLTNWPGVGKDAAEYFVEKKVKIVGADTLAIDVYNDSTFPAHYTLLGNDVLIMENLKNLEQLPAFSYFAGFPLKIKDGSGSPIRAVAYYWE